MWNILRLPKTTRCAKNSKKKRPKAQKRSSKGWSFFPLCEELQLEQRQQQRVQRRGQEGEREGLRQVSLREDNNRGAISERTKRSGFGEFFEVFKKIGLTFQRIDNNRGANSERTKGWALEILKC